MIVLAESRPCLVNYAMQSVLAVQLLNQFVICLFLKKKMYCSDERYHQFQVDGNLQYTCPTCRGECYQVCTWL